MLLRFLETGELQKVGSDHATVRLDVRVIAANRDLASASGRDNSGRTSSIDSTSSTSSSRHSGTAARISRPWSSTSFTGSRATAARQVAGIGCDGRHGRTPWPGNVRELENAVERSSSRPAATASVDDLPLEIRMQRNVSLRPKRERRRTVADDLYKRLVEEQESFWHVVYPMYMQREITRDNVREIVRRGLEEARGNYRIVAKLFNMAPNDYKRFLNFLRKHDCQLPFKEYRQ
jgi:transcriptional regulator with GAF, ATPase, and Fis domain